MKTIEVIVSPDGEVKIEAVGFSGSSCTKATEALEKALGVTKSKTKKKEFWAQEVQKIGGA